MYTGYSALQAFISSKRCSAVGPPKEQQHNYQKDTGTHYSLYRGAAGWPWESVLGSDPRDRIPGIGSLGSDPTSGIRSQVWSSTYSFPGPPDRRKKKWRLELSWKFSVHARRQKELPIHRSFPSLGCTSSSKQHSCRGPRRCGVFVDLLLVLPASMSR